MLQALSGIWVLLLIPQTKGKVGSCGSLRNQGDSPEAETSESHAWPSGRAQGLLTHGASPQHLGDGEGYPDSQRRTRDTSEVQTGRKDQLHIQGLQGPLRKIRMFLPPL